MKQEFLDQLDTGWGDAIASTYEEATPEIMWKEFDGKTGEEIINTSINKSTIKSTLAPGFGFNGDAKYVETYESNTRLINFRFTFENIIERSSYENLVYGALTAVVLLIDETKKSPITYLLSSFEINYGYDVKYPDEITLSYMKFKKDNDDYYVNHNFLEEFLKRAIDKLNESREDNEKIRDNIYPSIIKGLKENTKNILE